MTVLSFWSVLAEGVVNCNADLRYMLPGPSSGGSRRYQENDHGQKTRGY
jgi:hypothetical protein